MTAWWAQAHLLWVSTAVLLLTVAYLLLRHLNSAGSKLLIAFGVSLGAMGASRALAVSAADSADALQNFRYFYAFSSIASALFWHFCMQVLRLIDRFWPVLFLSWLLYSLLAMLSLESGLVVSSLRAEPWGQEVVGGLGVLALIILQTGQLGLCFYFCREQYQKALAQEDRQRLRWFFRLLILLCFAVSDFAFHLTGLGRPITVIMLVPCMLLTAFLMWRFGMGLKPVELLVEQFGQSDDAAHLIVTDEGYIRYASPGIAKLTGQPESAWVGKPLTAIFLQEIDAGRLRWCQRLKGQALPVRLRAAQESQPTLELSVNLAKPAAGAKAGYFCRLRVPRGQRSRDLEGTVTAQAFTARLHDALREAQQVEQSRAALLVAGVDRMSQINSAFGPDIGDQVLARLRSQLRQVAEQYRGEVYRSAGDQFLVLLQTTKLEWLPEDLERQLAALAEPLQTGRGECFASVTSVLVDCDPALDVAGHLSAASGWLQEARREFPGKLSRRTAARPDEELGFDSRIQQALDRGALVLEWTGRQDPVTQAIEGFLLSPALELPGGQWLRGQALSERIRAEELRSRLDLWVLQQWLARMPEVASQLPETACFALRLDQVSAHSAQFTDWLLRLVPATLRRRLTLVIAEHDSLNAGVQRELRRWHSAGIRIELADFGEGVSSMSCLHQLPISALRLSARVVREALVRPSARQMTLAVSKFAQRLDFRVIAEGVDSVVEREVVGALGFGLLEGAAAGGWQFAGGKQPVRIAPLADENPS